MKAASTLEWLVITAIIVALLAIAAMNFFNVWNPAQGNMTAASNSLLGALGQMPK